MTKSQKTFLFDLLGTPSPTGFEVEGQRKWASYARKFADSVDNDAYGTAWATLEGSAKSPRTVMIEAHADEIGYMINHITAEGFLHIGRIGGSDAATARGRRLLIYGDKGPVKGIIGNTAIHLRKGNASEKAPELHELYVDVGASDEAGVKKLGLRVGHPAVYQDSVEGFGKDRLVGRALDNRIGGYIIARVLENLSKGKKRPSATVYAVNAVQEEIGGFGAKMVTHRLRPDVAVCLDVTHATDTPGIPHDKFGKVLLGGGPSLTHGTGNHPEVVKRLMAVAKKAGIPIQHEASSRATGTDTDSIYPVRDGVPSALVSLPQRYMHSVVEQVHLDDVEKVISLLTGFVKSVTTKDVFTVKL
jgi:putative aminopeptidase FrvX